MTKKICIIGSGASGLTAIKSCIEENLDITCYERSDFLGGLWKYRDEDDEAYASVMRSTIINSSKELSAYSDFPPPKEFPNYMHNSLMLKYFQLYAEKFDLEKYIKYEHEVIKIVPAENYDETGKWSVEVKNRKTNEISINIFDGVMICTGHHVKPYETNFKGQEKFKGKIIHTHSYKKPEGYDDKKVLIVGIGNSGGDAAVELSAIAKQVYLSTRRGTWVVKRVGPTGIAYDALFFRRFLNLLFNSLPYGLICYFMELLANYYFSHEKYRLKPKHRILSQHPMVNDALPNRILSGTVILKHDIQEFTENGVIFKGDEKIIEIDQVILATGYQVHYPFIDKSIVWTENNEVELYKYMFVPKLKHPHTLCLLGLIQAYGPAIPISEMQARWFVQLMMNKCKPLPDYQNMMADIKDKRIKIAKRYFEGPRNTMQVDWINFLDELASQFGAKPNLLKYFFTDPLLWYALFFKPNTTYCYRLDGPHAWRDAREAILTYDERVDYPFRTRELDLQIDEQVNGLKLNGFKKCK